MNEPDNAMVAELLLAGYSLLRVGTFTTTDYHFTRLTQLNIMIPTPRSSLYHSIFVLSDNPHCRVATAMSAYGTPCRAFASVRRGL